ncbi:MAG: sporulation transcriptional regulator SpoIIID [Lachnospiraceae bacterium]|nr:sporulation transcriptional regulator SpoIIID [Lachnospiraceae bacterium]
MRIEERCREDLMKVLCKRYREIRQSCDEELLERVRMQEEYYESFEWFCELMQNKDPDTVIETMVSVSCATECILCRIDKAVEDYAEIAKKEGMQSFRQYDAIYSVYFSNSKSKIRDIAKKYRVRKSTIYDDIKEARNSLTTILFDVSEDIPSDNFKGE